MPSADRVRAAATALCEARYVRARQYLVDPGSSRRGDVAEGRFDLASGALEMTVRLPDERGDFDASSDTTTFLVLPPHHYFQGPDGEWYRTAHADRLGAPPTEPAALLCFLRSPALTATDRTDNEGHRVVDVDVDVQRALTVAEADDRASMSALASVLGVHDGALRGTVALAADGTLAGMELDGPRGRAGLEFFDAGVPVELPPPPHDAVDLDG